MRLLILMLLIPEAWAGFKMLDKTPVKPVVIVKTERFRPHKKAIIYRKNTVDPETKSAIKMMRESNAKVDALLRLRTNLPLILDQSFRFKTGDVLKGKLLNSVVSTNLESPLLVEIDPDQGLPEGSKFNCQGVTKFKRVITACNLLITESEEYAIDAVVLNTDGTSGLKGVYYTGKEEYIAGAIASQFAKGILEVSQSRTANLLGTELDNTPKNKLLQGMINSSNTVTGTLEEELNSKEPKVFIDAGKRVLIYFTQKFVRTP